MWINWILFWQKVNGLPSLNHVVLNENRKLEVCSFTVKSKATHLVVSRVCQLRALQICDTIVN